MIFQIPKTHRNIHNSDTKEEDDRMMVVGISLYIASSKELSCVENNDRILLSTSLPLTFIYIYIFLTPSSSSDTLSIDRT